MRLALALCSGLLLPASAARLGRRNSSAAAGLRSRLRANASAAAAAREDLETPSFTSYYASHTGRGMWKWNVALDAYDRHFSSFAGRPAKLLEIGVQSGGSIDMYRAVLPQCHYYGMDINKNCVQFQNPTASIYIGDQASIPVWTTFFTSQTGDLDMVIDDGGHQAHQMLTTIQMVLPHMNPGGFFCTEDIHGQNDDYLTKFLHPASATITGFASVTGAQVESVHLYPFLLGVQMKGGSPFKLPAATASFTTMGELMGALPNHLGGTLQLSNPQWPSFFTPAALQIVFSSFYGIYGGTVSEEPPACHDTMKSLCAMVVVPTPQQAFVKAVHILPTHVLVEVHAATAQIRADRKGQVWIPYNGP